MDLGRIKNLNSVSKSPEQKRENLSCKETVSKIKDETADLPVDPQYWKNVKIAFRGVKPFLDGEFEESLEKFQFDEKIKKKIKNLELEDDHKAMLISLINNEKLDKKGVEALLNRKIAWYNSYEKESLKNSISSLYKAFQEGDDEVFDRFRGLIENNFINGKLPILCINSIVSDKNSFDGKLVEYFCGLTKQTGSPIFQDVNKFWDIEDYVNEENFEDFKNFLEKDCPVDYQTLFFRFGDCVNPETELFDINLTKLASKLQEENLIYGNDDYFVCINAAKRFLEKDTGEVSKVATSAAERMFTGQNRLINIYSQDSLAMYLEIMRDKSENFNSQNVEYLEKLIKKEPNLAVNEMAFGRLFLSMQNKEGIVDKEKFELGIELYETSNNPYSAEFLLSLKSKDEKKYEKVRKLSNEMFSDEKQAILNSKTVSDGCFDVGGEIIPENVEFLKKMATKKPDIKYPEKVFKINGDKEKTDLLLTALDGDVNGSDIEAFLRVAEKYSNKEGKLHPYVKKEVEKFIINKGKLEELPRILDACFEDIFDETAFDRATIFSKYTKLASWSKSRPLYKAFIENNIQSPKNLNFADKILVLKVLKQVEANEDLSKPPLEFVPSMIEEIEKSLFTDNVSLKIGQKEKKDFMQSVVQSSGVNGEKTQFEKTLQNSIPILKQMPNGLKISYSREKFLGDLSKICESDEKRKILSEKTGISPIVQQGQITGYDGIITLENLDKNDLLQSNIYNLCHKFMYENEVKTGNKELDFELNKIIKAAPEFINTIGKKQHQTHKYSLDIHQLLVLANSINNPLYDNLNGLDKAMLKVSCLFHDITKAENAIDKGHQFSSSSYARSIIKKFFNNSDTKDRIYELIKNHHWLAEFSTSEDKETTAKELAFKFRRPNDFEIAKIMARADLMSVNDDFYEGKKSALDDKNIMPIENALNYFYSTGNAVLSDTVVSKGKVKTETLNGKDYKVINFHKISDKADMGEFGFAPGLKKEDLRFLVHMVSENEAKADLGTLKLLSSSVNDGVLSESLISVAHKRTYMNRRFGVLLSQNNANVVNMDDINQGSTRKKGFDNLIGLLYNDEKTRKNFRNGFLENLGLSLGEISAEDYGKFYKENLALKNSFTQFADNKECKIGNKTFKGLEIKKAIKKFQDGLIDPMEIHHNEIVGYTPNIEGVVAKAGKLEEIPSEFLNFAFENELPILLI